MSEITPKKEIKEIATSFPFKEQLLFFKDDILRELCRTEGKISKKMEISNLQFVEDISEIQRSIKEIKDKIISLSSSQSTNNIIQEKLNKFNSSFDRMSDNLLTQDIRVKTMSKDLRDAIGKYDKIIIDSLIFPGLIGNQAKYKTFHELIEFLFNNVNQLMAYKDKNYLYLEKNKKKLESLVDNFETKSELFTRNSNAFSHKILSICEESCKNILNNYINENKRNIENFKKFCENKINSISNNNKFFFDKVNNIEITLIEHINDFENFKKNQIMDKSFIENNDKIKKTNRLGKRNSILKPYIQGIININELLPNRDGVDIFGQKVDERKELRGSVSNPEFLKNKLTINKFGKNDPQENIKKRFRSRKSCFFVNNSSLIPKEKGNSLENNNQNVLSRRDSQLIRKPFPQFLINKDKDEKNDIKSNDKSDEKNNESNSNSISDNDESEVSDNNSNNKNNTNNSNKNSDSENITNKNSTSKNNIINKNDTSNNDTNNKNNNIQNNNDKEEKIVKKNTREKIRERGFSFHSPTKNRRIKPKINIEETTKNTNEKNNILKKNSISSHKKTFYLKNNKSFNVNIKKNNEDDNNIKLVEYHSNKSINKALYLNKKNFEMNVNKKQLNIKKDSISFKSNRPITSKRNTKFLSKSNKPNKKYLTNDKEKTQSPLPNLSNLSDNFNKDIDNLKINVINNENLISKPKTNINSPNKQLNEVEINFERQLNLKKTKENEMEKMTKTFNQIKGFIGRDEMVMIAKRFSKHGIDDKIINDK